MLHSKLRLAEPTYLIQFLELLELRQLSLEQQSELLGPELISLLWSCHPSLSFAGLLVLLLKPLDQLPTSLELQQELLGPEQLLTHLLELGPEPVADWLALRLQPSDCKWFEQLP